MYILPHLPVLPPLSDSEIGLLFTMWFHPIITLPAKALALLGVNYYVRSSSTPDHKNSDHRHSIQAKQHILDGLLCNGNNGVNVPPTGLLNLETLWRDGLGATSP